MFDEVSKLFGVKETDPIFYTYGDTIFSPCGLVPTADLQRHEETHAEQQEHHPDVAKMWWARYVQDQDFRIDQETEAYGEQYRWYCQNEKRRDMRAKYLFQIAKHLSGTMYGSIITHTEAMKRIREYVEMAGG